jgi:enamine deaminase RidA (YjgF/YER057c/UK114 family)
MSAGGNPEGAVSGGAEQRLRQLRIALPPAPTPFGAYVPAVQTGRLLFLSGMLPTDGHAPKIVGHLGKELDVDAGRDAARIATLNALAVARENLGSLDRISHVVRLGVSIAVWGDFVDHVKVADAASELLGEVFGPERTSSRLIFGVSSLPLGVPIELEVVFETAE